MKTLFSKLLDRFVKFLGRLAPSFDNITVLFSLSVSIASFTFSLLAYKNTNEQFTVINQSYLKTQPLMDVHSNMIPGGRSTVINDSLMLDGINAKLDVENLGNVPVKYKLTSFAVEIGDTLMGDLNTEKLSVLTTESILYPKESSTYTLNTVYFPNSEQYSISELKSKKIKISYSISYSDLGTSHEKYVDRKYIMILDEGKTFAYLDVLKDKIN